MSSISGFPRKTVKSKIIAYSDFAPLTSMLKILSDPIIKQKIGSFKQINKSLQLQLCFGMISCFLSACHQINTKYNQNLEFFGRSSIQNVGIAL